MITSSRITRNAGRTIPCFCAVVVVLLMVAVGPVDAATLFFNTSDSQFTPGVDNQGWWGNVATNNDPNDDYITGSFTSQANETRSFFTFDLSSLSQTALSATLEVVRYRYSSPDPSETLGLFDVTTDAATLNNNTGPDAAIFADLGSGTTYGTFVIPAYSFSNTETLTFPLNAGAIANINASTGFFSIGGALLSLNPSNNYEFVFNTASGFGIQRLIVETAASSAVPQPSTLLLLGVGGLVSLAGTILRRKA